MIWRKETRIKSYASSNTVERQKTVCCQLFQRCFTWLWPENVFLQNKIHVKFHKAHWQDSVIFFLKKFPFVFLCEFFF
jgi:hypothetical protein